MSDFPRGVVLLRENLPLLIDGLKTQGYRVAGPVLNDGAIGLEEIESARELATGVQDHQQPGKYRLTPGDEGRLFDYVVGPQSWKKFLFPPSRRLFNASRTGREIEFFTPELPTDRWAFFGIRACEIAALHIQDKVFLGGPYADPYYKVVREELCLIGLNCTNPAETCFCSSLGTGPRCTSGHDIVLTEIHSHGEEAFLVEIETARGERLLECLPTRPADEEDYERAAKACLEASNSIHRSIATEDLAGVLARNFEHNRWEETAERCLSCGNCTQVCPTCFCSTVEDFTDLAGQSAERVKRWDSCFTLDFSYIHGGSIRVSNKSRYRQWLTHKLGTWTEQFGTLGCVGCGRCITWCPVGIDLTEEVAALRERDHVHRKRQEVRSNG